MAVEDIPLDELLEGQEDARLLDEKTKVQSSHSFSRAFSSSQITRTLSRFGFFLLPSFVQSYLRPQPVETRRLHPTAFLDGMRGLAALFVFFYHLFYSTHDVLSAYGTGGEGKNREFLKLPFIRFIYTGPAMVAVFYIVSGYALSYKPVRLMQARKWEELFHTLTSSVFRRAIRLFLPCIVSTLLIVFLVRIGLYDLTRGVAENDKLLTHVREYHLQRKDSLYQQLAQWSRMMWKFIHPWSFGTKDTDINIDKHLWTIPMEFRSSLVLYLTQLGLARMKPYLRVASLASLILWCLFKDRWEMVLFYSGFYLAELDQLRKSRVSAAAATAGVTTPTSSPRSAAHAQAWNVCYVIVFLIGIYLGSQPQTHVTHAPGWATLYSWIPNFVTHKQRYWVGWGAICLVWSTSNAPFLQRIFDNRPVQYLGKISFALYLMHGPVTHTLGYGTMGICWHIIGRSTYLRREVAFVIAAVIDVLATICIADVFWRAVDIPVVDFGKWFENKCIVALE